MNDKIVSSVNVGGYDIVVFSEDQDQNVKDLVNSAIDHGFFNRDRTAAFEFVMDEAKHYEVLEGQVGWP